MPMFVTVEGIDGTGKSSVCEMLHKALVDKGFKVKLTREPTDSGFGRLVKENFDKDISPFSEALLFCADRVEHTRDIHRWIGDGFHVISDRYVDSTVAYQGAVLEPHYNGEDLLGWLMDLNEPFIIVPDLTLLLLADPEVCLERLGARDEKTKFERLGTLKAVQKNYLEVRERANKGPLGGKSRFVTIDAERPLEEVASKAIEIVATLFERDPR
jgi:dTMP kinase